MLVTLASCAKMAELTKMPFRVQVRMGPRNYILHWCAYGRHLVNRIEQYVLGCCCHSCSNLLVCPEVERRKIIVAAAFSELIVIV